MAKTTTMNCCLCGLPYERVGNNPHPLAMKGRCCDACNEVVIQARMFPAEMMEEIERVEKSIFGKLGIGLSPHQVSVEVICCLRGPGLLAAKQRDLARMREVFSDERDGQSDA